MIERNNYEKVEQKTLDITGMDDVDSYFDNSALCEGMVDAIPAATEVE